MECSEKGILTKENAGDMEIDFGDAETMLKLVHAIAKREGVGDLLAEGTRIMAKTRPMSRAQRFLPAHFWW
jgi:aldehyde:ferredoxin oxidoreductase